MKNRFILLLFLICHIQFTWANDLDSLDAQIEYAAHKLDSIILDNNKLQKEGKLHEKNFVVDLRYELHKKLNEIDYVALNTRLQKINEREYNGGSHIAFYVLLTTIQKPILAGDIADGTTDYPNLKAYLEVTKGITDDQWLDYINSTKGAASEEDYKRRLRAFTDAVHRKSLLANQTNKGILLNLHTTWELKPGSTYSYIAYRAVLSLGQGLRNTSTLQSLKIFKANDIGDTYVATATHKKFYDSQNEQAPLNRYMVKVEQVLFNLGNSVNNYDTDPTGQNLEEEETFMEMALQTHSNLRMYERTSEPKELVGHPSLRVYDYCGITQFDKNFFTKVRQITDNGGAIKVSDIQDGEPSVIGSVKTYVFVTSDHNKGDFEKYARELVLQKKFDRNYNQDKVIIIGIHLYTNEPLHQDNQIRMQITTTFHYQLEQTIFNLRNDVNNGLYCWFINNKTGDILFCNPVALNSEGKAYSNSENWDYLSKRRVETFDGQIFNKYSNNYLLYKFLDNTDESEELFQIFIFTIELEAAIILAVPTGGFSAEVFVAEQAAKYIIKQSAKTALMSALMQYGVHYLVNINKPASEIYKTFRLDVSDLATDVMTDVLIKDKQAQNVLVCLNGMMNKYDALQQAGKPCTTYELADGCMRDLIVFSVVGKAGNVFKHLKAQNIEKLVNAFKTLKFSDATTKKLLKHLGYSDLEIARAMPTSSSSVDQIDPYDGFLRDNITAINATRVADLDGGLSNEDFAKLQGFRFTDNDQYIDLLIHSDGRNFFAYIETPSGRKHILLGADDLAEVIARNLPGQGTKPIRLLSCNNLETAEVISTVLNRKVVTTPASVRFHKDGGITTDPPNAQWYSIEGSQRVTISSPKPPADNIKDKDGEYVEMGKSSSTKIQRVLRNRLGSETDEFMSFVIQNTELAELLNSLGERLDDFAQLLSKSPIYRKKVTQNPNYVKAWRDYDPTMIYNINGIKPVNSGYAGSFYTTKSGRIIRFDENGFPDFTPFIAREPGGKLYAYEIEMTGVDYTDFKKANELAGFGSDYKAHETCCNGQWADYTWHHHQDGRTMMLVPKDVNNPKNGGVSHTGGRQTVNNNKNNPNNPLYFPPPHFE